MRDLLVIQLYKLFQYQLHASNTAMLNNKYTCKNYYSFYDDCISYFKGATATYFQTSSSQLYITHTSSQKLKPLSIELIRQEATITPLKYIYIVISIAWVSEWVSEWAVFYVPTNTG